MTETSFPVVGADFTSGEWSQALTGVGNSVLNDWGNPYAITLNTNDTATIAVSTVSGVARAVVAGFGHLLTAAVILPIPAVTSTTTYTIGLLYDPAQAATPVLLTVKTGAVVLTTGQVWLPLHVIVRQASQALTSAVLSTPMLKAQPRASAGSEAALLAQNPQLYLAGTTVYCSDTARTHRASLVGSTPTWVSLETTGAFTPTGLYAAGTPTPAVTSLWGRVSMTGIVTSSSATFVAGTSYTIGTIPSAFAPATPEPFACTANGTAMAQVTVFPTGSIVIVLNTGWSTPAPLNLSLSGLIWKAVA